MLAPSAPRPESTKEPNVSMPTAAVRCPVCGWELPDPVPGNCPRPSCGVALLPGTPLRVATFRLVGHYSLFVLPFSFEGDGDELRRLDGRLRQSGRWRERVFSLSDPADVDRTEYFLPYIRRFLFPSLYAPPRTPGAATEDEPTCRHFEFDLPRLGPVDKDGLPLTARWRDGRKKTEHEARLLLEKAELIVFSYRVGFLVLRVRCAGPASWFEQMAFTAVLRTLAPLYRDFQMPELDVGSARCTMPQLLSFLLAEFGGPVPSGGLEQATALGPLPVKPVYDDRMMVYTFSCLDRDTCLPDVELCQALLHKESVVNFDEEWGRRPPGPSASRDPSAWQRQRWQAFSKDGGSLVVFDTDAYHARYAGIYHGTYYFDVFLLATMQRVTLLGLFERLADIRTLTKGAAGRRLLRRVRRDLLLFKNQCGFSQITNRERGLLLWRKWQKTLETHTLLREVNEQSSELNSYLEGRHRERMDRLIKVGGFLAAAVPVVWGLDTFFDRAEWATALRWVLLGLLLAGSAVVAWYVVFRQEDL
jgi:hypothetical protein